MAAQQGQAQQQSQAHQQGQAQQQGQAEQERTTFGWCNYANHLPRMMNSLRLELMDESALLTLEGEKDAYYHHVCVVGECLVQVLVLKELPATGAFCSEKAREIKKKRCLCRRTCPPLPLIVQSVREKFYKLIENLPQARKAQPTLVAAGTQVYTVTECPLGAVNHEEWKFRESDRITCTALVKSGDFYKAMIAAQN